MKRVHIIVGGIVQGVCFRYYAQRRAEELGVAGWVRNLPDGRVESVLEGEAADIDKMVNWFRKGPPGAVVDEIRVDDEQYRGEFEDFRIGSYWR